MHQRTMQPSSTACGTHVAGWWSACGCVVIHEAKGLPQFFTKLALSSNGLLFPLPLPFFPPFVQLLLERHGGEVPACMEALEALPGVGHKTASVVACQAFGQDAFPVDTHIHVRCCRGCCDAGRALPMLSCCSSSSLACQHQSSSPVPPPRPQPTSTLPPLCSGWRSAGA